VRKLRLRDEDGNLTGVKGRVVDVDVLVEDEKVYVIEVKSRAELEHVEAPPLKSQVVGEVLGKLCWGLYLSMSVCAPALAFVGTLNALWLVPLETDRLNVCACRS